MGTTANDAPRTRQPTLGVLMLDTRFPRWPGDIGCAQGLAGAVIRRRVVGALPRRVVVDAAALRSSALDRAFEAAAHELVAAGATVLATSCGFLVLLQSALQQALPVPLVSSSLLQLPALLEREPRVGVLTIAAAALGVEHLRAAGVPESRLGDVVVEGVAPDSAFACAILGNQPTLDAAQAGRDVVAAALALKRRAPALRRVVLECTNMPPFARAIAQASGLDPRWLRHDPRLRRFFADTPAVAEPSP
jgi:hypothetical protein